MCRAVVEKPSAILGWPVQGPRGFWLKCGYRGRCSALHVVLISVCFCIEREDAEFTGAVGWDIMSRLDGTYMRLKLARYSTTSHRLAAAY